MKTYEVTATMKYPPCYYRPDVFVIVAQNAKEAISKARRQAWNEGTFSREDGAITYSAKAV